MSINDKIIEYLQANPFFTALLYVVIFLIEKNKQDKKVDK
jgi:hypothetical protein